jgi:hypothetical protein
VGATGTQPYAEFLNRVPEEVRGQVEPVFADWNRSVNGRFEEAANYRKQWEPYEQAGLNQYDPQALAQHLQMLQDAEATRQWYEANYPQQTQQQPQEQQPEFQAFDQYDPSAQFKQLLTPLEQRLEQLTQQWEQQQQRQHEQAIESALEAEVARLEAEHGKSLPEGVKMADVIERYGNRYAVPGADPVQVAQKAWSDYQTWANALAAAALQQKVDNQPAPAVSGGEADLAPAAPKGLKEAERIAREQIKETIRANGGFSIG